MKGKELQIDQVQGAIRRCIKTPTGSGQAPGLQIDPSGGAIRKCMKTPTGLGRRRAGKIGASGIASEGDGKDGGNSGQRTSLSAVLLRFKKKEYRMGYYLSSED